MAVDRGEYTPPANCSERVATQARSRMTDEYQGSRSLSDGRLTTPLSDARRSTEPAGSDLMINQIMDNKVNVTEKLAAVRELSHSGMSKICFKGADGQDYALRTETEKLGSKEMVHLFVTLPDGKERVVLRGIARPDGSFEREKASGGQNVDFYGKGAAMLFGGDNGAPPQRTRDGAPDFYQFDGSGRDLSTGGAPDNYRFDGSRRNYGNDGAGGIRRQPGPADLSARDDLRQPTEQTPPADMRGGRSMYERYRREEERRERDQRNPFGDVGPDSGNQASINKIMDDAQRAAHNSINQLIRTPQGVYMRARMDIDADGSPRARQIDPTGQTKTSMRYTDGSSVNAEEVPYMVLPGGQYSQFGIKLGDMCLVRNKENGKVAVAVFADVGPRQKRGEGSIKLAEELGINPSPTRGGTTRPNVEYLVLPGTGYPAQSQQQLLARINAQKQRLGLS